ncbi:MAG: toll/interleukin-1 receptor domain-containing protein [Acidimicrobiia bacterium]
MAFWLTPGTSVATVPPTTTATDAEVSSSVPPETTSTLGTDCAEPSGTATALLVHPTQVEHDVEAEPSASVDVVVTLDLTAQPGALLPGVPSLTSTTLELPCRLQGSLTAGGVDAGISPGGSLSGTLSPGGAITWRWEVSAGLPLELTLRLAGEGGSAIIERRVDIVIVLSSGGPTTTAASATTGNPPATVEPPGGTAPGRTTSVGPSPVTTTGGSLTDECRRRTQNPGPGVWRPPADATGTVGSTLTVRAVLSADADTAVPPDDATGSSAAPVTIPTVTCRVEARLVGPPGAAEFDASWSERTVRAALATAWVWQVTPIRDGEIPLTVELRGIAENGERFDLALPARFVLSVAPAVASGGPSTDEVRKSGGRGMVEPRPDSDTLDQLPGFVVPTSVGVAALSGAGLFAYRRRRQTATVRGRIRPAAGIDVSGGPTRVFLSYSRRDGAAASRLARDLEAHGWEVWMDTEDIAGGESWRRSIVDGLQSAHAVILMVSPNSMVSSNVERELTIADDEGKRVFPVMVAATDLVSGFKYLLAGVQIIDITGASHAPGVERLIHAIETHRAELSG